MAAEARDFDVVVYGATGFTGRLIAEHLLATYGVGGDLSWALAARSRSKIEGVRREIGAPESLPIVIADAGDPSSLLAMAQRAKTIIAAVGPYQLYGEGLIAACATTGTDYVDLCGEPAWMAAMIKTYHAHAQRSGARLVFSCGFDSIPFDLGVVFLQAEAKARLGTNLPRVKGRVRAMKGGFSGGTVASLIATLESAQKDPTIVKTLDDPFALTPGFCGPDQPKGDKAVRDDAARAWAAPFIMASINTKNVHRTNFLLGHPFGTAFVYDEMMLTGDGPQGQKRAQAAARTDRIQNALLGFGPTRALLRAFALPKPGAGPSKEERETGHFDVLFIGSTTDGRELRASVKGERDPGYGATSKMIAEAGICLARDVTREQTPGGVWTPGAAMGRQLIERLERHAGLRFTLEN